MDSQDDGSGEEVDAGDGGARGENTGYPSYMRMAIVADWLTTFGGAERVIAELARLYPEALVFTTVVHRCCSRQIPLGRIRTTRLQWGFVVLRRHQMLLPWMPRAVEDIDLRDFDIILGSSHAVSKGCIPPPTAVHVCYCHTPMRYAWEMEEQYFDDFHIPKRLRAPLRCILKHIRRWDLQTAKRVDHFIANSTTTQERIKRIYNRESVVIPPPVHDRFFERNIGPKSYFLSVSRLVPYKRIDLLIAAANAKGLPLKIAGEGQDRRRLERLAGPTVTFLGHVPDDDLPMLYTGACALLFPAFEDAGLAPMEAQACGIPVIAYGKGGVCDTVEDGTTGIFFHEQSLSSLLDAIGRFHQISWDYERIRVHAQQFSAERFRERVSEEVGRAIERVGRCAGRLTSKDGYRTHRYNGPRVPT